MVGMTTPIVSRGWCSLTTCTWGPVTSDCVRFGEVTVCALCLIDLGGGVERNELDNAEEELRTANDRIDVLEGRLEQKKE